MGTSSFAHVVFEMQQQIEEEQLISQLHFLDIRPDYTWKPSPLLSEIMQFNQPLFTTNTLTDDKRKVIIEQYPGQKDMDYQHPDTVPLAARAMKPHLKKQDRSLKRLQYLALATFRPLDGLALELSNDNTNPNVQRYLHMLNDCRSLLLNLTSDMTEMRKTIAFQAINPCFSSTDPSSQHTYIMPVDNFQAALAQQTITLQNVQKASRFDQRPQVNTNQTHFSHTTQPQQFFRIGPSSQQGGYNTHNTQSNKFSKPTYNKFNKSDIHTDRRNTNPFRQPQQQQ
ncbi:hypothetical protein BD560DRAFT_459511 [Blakeslea trispora]|nr:hypothetical protein BD560DRAFT_459511 [Blakeslea trispora]